VLRWSMSEQVTPRQFHEAEGVHDWRVVFEGACAHFRTGSFTTGVALVEAIGKLASSANRHPDVDLRSDNVTVRLRPDDTGRQSEGDVDAPRPQRNRIHVDVSVPHDQAEARVAAGIAAGGHVVSDRMAPEWWVLADAEGNEACVATWVGRG
jgi:4a-hydroxytetrahydrobiopterin dehydratase